MEINYSKNLPQRWLPGPDNRLRFNLSNSITVLSAGKEIEKLLGYTSDDLVAGSIDFKQLIHKDDLEIVQQLFSPTLIDTLITLNFRMRRKSGRIQCLRACYKKTFNKESEEILLELYLQDAASLKQDIVDQTLLYNFTAMMETTDDYIYFKDRNHVFTGASQTLVSVTDPSEHWTDLIGLTDYDVFPEEYADKYYSLEKQVFSGEITVAHEIQPTLDNEGNHGWVDNRKYPIKDEKGEIIGLFGIARNITDLKEMQVSLQEKIDQLETSRRIFEEAGDPILLLKDGQYFDCNSAAWNYLGYPDKQTFLSKSPIEISIPQQSDGQTLKEKFDQMVEIALDKGIHRFEWQHRHFDGSAVDVEVTLTSMEMNSMTILHVHWRDITDRKQLLKSMSWQAMHDVLTGLANRTLLTDRFEQALSHANRHHSRLAVCMIDLDGFKPVNDQYGHQVGDQLLIEVANRMTKMLRAEDTVARLGGDEFVILLSDLEQTLDLDVVLERLLNAISLPYSVDDHSLTISASIGVALYPDDKVDTDTLLRHADQAMYMAKQDGRNCIRWFDIESEREIYHSHEILNQVRFALTNNELNLYYQPKVNMRTGEVIGMEALLRWIYPDKGIIPPLDFLPAVDQTDIIIEIGNWVIESALAQISDWTEQGYPWPVSVNIAARHFQRPDFFDRLKASLSHYPEVSRQRLEIEILESVAIDDMQHVRNQIIACQQLGVSVSLDDFGTGYSSLSYLKCLPADTLKIDQSFVRDILEDTGDRALVEAVIGLASIFKRKVIAEGVESVEHGVLLMDLGCDWAQGNGIAKAMPAEQIIDWADQFTPDVRWTDR